jgi:hypothetical protein
VGTGMVAISTLAVGDLVMGYDPTTGEAKPEPIEAVHIHNDDNLLDVSLSKTLDTNADHDSMSSPSESSQKETKESSRQTSETVHTTTEHPFLTTDRSFVDAEDLHLGEQIIESDGSIGTVLAVTVVPGLGIRYNLTVKDLHTFMVGDGRWVVHNCGGLVEYGSTVLSKAIQTARLAAKDKLGNYAAALLEDGSTIIKRSSSKWGPHAEGFLIDESKSLGKKIVELYSEREPCAAKCVGLLRGEGITKVTWSFPWNGITQEEAESIRKATNQAFKQAMSALFAK